MPEVLLLNNKTGALEPRDAADMQTDLDSGKYSKTKDSTVSLNRLGATANTTPEDAKADIDYGATVNSGAKQFSEKQAKDQRDAFDTGKDKAFTFAEGVVDAASFGLIHEHGGQADLRRDVNEGSAIAGQIVGSFLPGPGAVMGAGKTGGRLVAKTLLRDVEQGFGKFATRVTEEAGAGAAIAGATSFGHQVSDVLFDDKPFVGEAVLNDIKLGGLLGGAFGGLLGLSEIGRKLGPSTKAQVAAGGGLIDPASGLSTSIASDVKAGLRSFDEAVEQHSMRVGVLEQLAKDGHPVPLEALATARKLEKEAQAARKKFGTFDIDEALAGHDMKAYTKWRDAMEDYQSKLVSLDEHMSGQAQSMKTLKDARLQGERMQSVKPGPEFEFKDVDAQQIERNAAEGAASQEAINVHARMESDPVARERYKEINGREWTAPDELAAVDEAHPGARFEGGENLGGDVTPTSDLATGAASGKGRQRIAEPGAVSVQENANNFKQHRDVASGDSRVMPSEMMPGNYETSYQRPTIETPVEAPPKTKEFPRLKDPTAPTVEIKAEGPIQDPLAAIRQHEVGPGQVAAKAEGKAAVAKFIDDWAAQSSAPRPSPGDYAASKLSTALDQIKMSTNGALDSAAVVDLLKAQKIRPASTAFGTTLDSIIQARQIGHAAADASRGVKTPMAKAQRNWLMSWIGGKAAGKMGAAVAGGTVGGPVGFALGAALGDKLFGFAGKAAGSAGRAMQTAQAAVKGLLSNQRGAIVAKAIALNQPVAYSDEGPIKDPIKRIEEVKRVAANPEALKNYLREKLGDLAYLHPEITDSILNLSTQRVVNLAVSAPAIYYDHLNNAIGPATQALRRWQELENATHNPGEILDAITQGNPSEAQIQALRTQHPGLHRTIIGTLLSDQEGLQSAPRSKIKVIEQILQMPLSYSGTPAYVSRSMMNWRAHDVMPQSNPGKPDAKAMATPASAGARAPGN